MNNKLLNKFLDDFDEDRRIRWRDEIRDALEISEMGAQSWTISEKVFPIGYRQLLLGEINPDKGIEAKIIFELADNLEQIGNIADTELKIEIRKDYALIIGLHSSLSTKFSLETQTNKLQLRKEVSPLINYSGTMFLGIFYRPRSQPLDIPEFRYARDSWRLLSDLDNTINPFCEKNDTR